MNNEVPYWLKKHAYYYAMENIQNNENSIQTVISEVTDLFGGNRDEAIDTVKIVCLHLGFDFY